MLKGGVIMDVMNVEQAKIAEKVRYMETPFVDSCLSPYVTLF